MKEVNLAARSVDDCRVWIRWSKRASSAVVEIPRKLLFGRGRGFMIVLFDVPGRRRTRSKFASANLRRFLFLDQPACSRRWGWVLGWSTWGPSAESLSNAWAVVMTSQLICKMLWSAAFRTVWSLHCIDADVGQEMEDIRTSTNVIITHGIILRFSLSL